MSTNSFIPQRLFSLFLLLCLSTTCLLAQPMEVSNNPPITPENLITNVFLGSGVEVLNIQFDGTNNAVGFFQEAETAIGIDRGLVMSTGNASLQSGGEGTESPGTTQSASMTSGNSLFDPDLIQISNGVTTNDIVRYSITFIPISDTLRFNYVFGSEEYPEYACSSFNDIFGFFISGPGINGPYSNNAENIAIIPGTNLPVTINNVNPGVPGDNGGVIECTPPNGSLAFSEFYNDNLNSGTAPVFDGFTDVFTAEAVVIPCSTYTIKLVIADVSDTSHDSGVFLEAKSFGTGSLQPELTTVSLDGTVAEGCSEGLLSFSLPAPTESDFLLDYEIFGTAENGIDYETIPPDLFIPAGDSVVSIPIVAFADGLDEGSETILIGIQRDPCNRDTLLIPITDNELVPPELRPDTIICRGDTLPEGFIDATVDVVLPEPPRFTNSAPLVVSPPLTPIFSDIEVFGVQPFELGPDVIVSVCIDDLQTTWADDLQMYLFTPGGQFMELVTDIGNPGDNFIGTCFTPTATNPITDVVLADQPFTGEYAPEGLWSDLWSGESPTNGTWRLSIYDKFFADTPVLNEWSITFRPLYEINYSWEPADGLSCADCPSPEFFPDTTTTYVVTATDAYGCITADTIIVEVRTLDADTILQGVSCAGDNDGLVTLDINSNGGPFQFDWSNGQTDSIAINLGAGLIELALSDDSTGCTYDYSFDVLEPDSLMATAAVDSVDCAGNATGEALVLPSGGSGPYTVFFDPGVEAGPVNGQAVNLGTGTYNYTVRDDNNCIFTDTFPVFEPDSLSLQLSATDALCADSLDGQANVLIEGGTPAYTYEWLDEDGLIVGSDASLQNIGAGNYTLSILDANGCPATQSVFLDEPPALLVSVDTTDAICAGINDGAAEAIASGGTGNYTFTWSDMGPDTPDRDGLSSGNYTVSVSDGNGCLLVTDFVIGASDSVAFILDAMDVSCNGLMDGSATVVPTGGTAPYVFDWSGGQTTDAVTDLSSGVTIVTVTDVNGCLAVDSVDILAPPALTLDLEVDSILCNGSTGQITAAGGGGIGTLMYNWSNGQDTPIAADLTAGSYSVTITDENSCTLADTLVISEPTALTTSTSSTTATCQPEPDGSATISAGGGTPPYSYLWSNGETLPIAQSLIAGTYFVTVTDDNDCTVVDSVVVDGTFPIELSQDAQPVSCNGRSDGSGTVTAVGGQLPYSYDWGAGLPDSPTQSNLSAGTYVVTVTDASGCEASIEIIISEPSVLLISTTTSMITCSGSADGSASVTVGGGTQPYNILWSNGDTDPQTENLGLGSYTVQVTDANGCEASGEVVISEASPINITVEVEDIDCYGDATGAATLAVSGGLPPYTYAWPNGINEPGATDLVSDLYLVTITDAADCALVEEVFVPQPNAPLEAVLMATDVSCYGSEDGRIEVEVEGGTPGYRYSLDGEFFSGSSTFLGLSPGAYGVLVEDDNGCTLLLDAVGVNEPDPIIVDLGSTRAIPFGEVIRLRPEITGGVGAFGYDWFPQDSSLLDCFECSEPLVSVDFQASVRVVVTDETGCTGEDIVNVYATKNRPILVPTGFSPNDDSQNDRLIVHARDNIELNIVYYRIFDRWGEILYEATDFQPNDPTFGWDGTFRGELLNSGTFIWAVGVEYRDGLQEEFRGHTNLIR